MSGMGGIGRMCRMGGMDGMSSMRCPWHATLIICQIKQASNWSQQTAGPGAGAGARISCTECVAGGCGYAGLTSDAIGRGRKHRKKRWCSGCGYARLTSDAIGRGRKERTERWCSGCSYAGLTSDAIGRGRKQRKARVGRREQGGPGAAHCWAARALAAARAWTLARAGAGAGERRRS